MHKRYFGWGTLILIAFLLTVFAKPVATQIYVPTPLEMFRARPDYKLHMKGLRTTEIKIRRKMRRDAAYQRKLNAKLSPELRKALGIQ